MQFILNPPWWNFRIRRFLCTSRPPHGRTTTATKTLFIYSYIESLEDIWYTLRFEYTPQGTHRLQRLRRWCWGNDNYILSKRSPTRNNANKIKDSTLSNNSIVANFVLKWLTSRELLHVIVIRAPRVGRLEWRVHLVCHSLSCHAIWISCGFNYPAERHKRFPYHAIHYVQTI